MDALLYDEIFHGEMGENQCDANTIADYLGQMFSEAWSDGDNFYPDSDWQWKVYEALIANGIIEGSLDEDGCIDEIDIPKADKIICDFISCSLNTLN